jgi:hypothetical protein
VVRGRVLGDFGNLSSPKRRSALWRAVERLALRRAPAADQSDGERAAKSPNAGLLMRGGGALPSLIYTR